MKKKIKQFVVVLVMVSILLPVLSDFSKAAGTYIVQPGDSLWKIANKFNTSISTLRQMNNIWNNYLDVGQRIMVPGQDQNQYYTVVWGDSLWKISQKTGVSITQLKEFNNLSSSYLEVGQTLHLTRSTGNPGPAPTPTPTTPVVKLSETEVDLLARLIHAESSGEPYLGKVGVGAVIVNRLRSPLFPNTLNGVLHQKYAFESVETGYIWTINPTSSEYQAAREALSGVDPTKKALFFYNPNKITNPNNWVFSRQVTVKIGNHLFAL